MTDDLKIVIRAEIRSPTAHAFGSWHHGNISYFKHIYEDPFCNPDKEVSIVLYHLLCMCSLTIYIATQELI